MEAFPPPGGAPRRDRLVGLGLAMVALGWLALVADLVLADAGLQPGGLVTTLALKGDVATLAQALIATGLGLALLGGLREGFGALGRFFDAVLQRSAAGRPAAPPEPDPAPAPVPPVRAPAVERAPPPERAAPMPVERAAAAARNFQILPDGSVEVETLLGTRVFASMDEARDFIR